MNVLMCYADVSKSKEISKWRPIDEDLHDHFSAMKTFFKNRQDSSHVLSSYGFNKAKQSSLYDYEGANTQTDCYNPLPML